MVSTALRNPMVIARLCVLSFVKIESGHADATHLGLLLTSGRSVSLTVVLGHLSPFSALTMKSTRLLIENMGNCYERWNPAFHD